MTGETGALHHFEHERDGRAAFFEGGPSATPGFASTRAPLPAAGVGSAPDSVGSDGGASEAHSAAEGAL